MSENDYTKTPNQFLSALCFLRDEITKAYRNGDNDFLSRKEIIDALEFVVEPIRAHADAEKIIAGGTLDEFVNIGNEFENAFSRWVKMALIPDYQNQLDEIRADMIPCEGIDFLCMYRPDDYLFLPFAFDPNPNPINGKVDQFTKAGGYDNLWKLIYIGKTIAQARKGAERIETKHAEKKARRPVSIETMARYAGVVKKTIVNWENGKGTPKCECGQYSVMYCAAIRNSELTARTFGEIYRAERNAGKIRVSLSVAEREEKIKELAGYLSMCDA